MIRIARSLKRRERTLSRTAKVVHHLRDPSAREPLTSRERRLSFDFSGVELALPFDGPLQETRPLLLRVGVEFQQLALGPRPPNINHQATRKVLT